MKEKKDIFNGNIKKEYFSYILIYIIFIALLWFVLGGMTLGVGLWANAGPMLAIIFMRLLGVVFIALGIAYVVGCMLVIRKYPKYEKLRRKLYNSDCYFTDSSSKEYYGRIRGIRGHSAKSAFHLVTAFAEVEKGMGDKKPVRYTVYSAITVFMSVLGMLTLIVMPLLFEENGTIFPNMSEGDFGLCCVFIGTICVAITAFFCVQSLKVATMAPYKNNKWRYELYNSLVDIAVRKNNKKLKFWYNKDQLEQIESLVKAASENAELKLIAKRNKIVSFKVIDTRNNSVKFTGYFI